MSNAWSSSRFFRVTRLAIIVQPPARSRATRATTEGQGWKRNLVRFC
jgi:hypothetical protein